MNKELISVIVPVFNVEKYLERCVETIVNQTYKNLEIILVNDGSTDNSGELCDELARRDDRINRIIRDFYWFRWLYSPWNVKYII